MLYLVERLVRSLAFRFCEICLECFSSQLKCFIFNLEIVLGFYYFSPVPLNPGCKMQGFPEPYKLWNLFPFDSVKDGSN